MWQQFWHDMARSLGPVYFCLGISYLVSRALFRRAGSRKTYKTYILADGGLNSLRVTLDAEIAETERTRILSEYGRILASYAPAFDASAVQNVGTTHAGR